MSSVFLIINLVLLVFIAIFIFFNQSEATGLGLDINKKSANNFFVSKKGDGFFYKTIFGLGAVVVILILLSSRSLNQEYGSERFLKKIEEVNPTIKEDQQKIESPEDVLSNVK